MVLAFVAYNLGIGETGKQTKNLDLFLFSKLYIQVPLGSFLSSVPTQAKSQFTLQFPKLDILIVSMHTLILCPWIVFQTLSVTQNKNKYLRTAIINKRYTIFLEWPCKDRISHTSTSQAK